MSQLDLALTADVSARHISFLETGRAGPSESMILRLAGVLDIPMREQNAMLRAAGFEPLFQEPDPTEGLSAAIAGALDRMLAHQEPFPMVVMNRLWDVIRQNKAADRLLKRAVADPTSIEDGRINALRMLFDPRQARPFIVNWERAARMILTRLQREVLHHPEDSERHDLLEELLSYPGVPEHWRQPDLASGNDATFTVQLQRDGLRLGFLTTLTVFSAPQNVTLEELRIESYFPLDPETQMLCEGLARQADD